MLQQHLHVLLTKNEMNGIQGDTGVSFRKQAQVKRSSKVSEFFYFTAPAQLYQRCVEKKKKLVNIEQIKVDKSSWLMFNIHHLKKLRRIFCLIPFT